jgi:hypothetical protein
MQSTVDAHFALKMNGFSYHIAHIHQGGARAMPGSCSFFKIFGFPAFHPAYASWERHIT